MLPHAVFKQQALVVTHCMTRNSVLHFRCEDRRHPWAEAAVAPPQGPPVGVKAASAGPGAGPVSRCSLLGVQLYRHSLCSAHESLRRHPRSPVDEGIIYCCSLATLELAGTTARSVVRN